MFMSVLCKLPIISDETSMKHVYVPLKYSYFHIHIDNYYHSTQERWWTNEINPILL